MLKFYQEESVKNRAEIAFDDPTRSVPYTVHFLSVDRATRPRRKKDLMEEHEELPWGDEEWWEKRMEDFERRCQAIESRLENNARELSRLKALALLRLADARRNAAPRADTTKSLLN
jgi:hypothetical protein